MGYRWGMFGVTMIRMNPQKKAAFEEAAFS